MSNSSCPKCQGPRDAKALYCPFCGVIFARYIAAPTPSPSPGAPAVPAAKSSPFAPDSSPFAPDSSPPPFEDQGAPTGETLYGGPPPPSGNARWDPYQAPSQSSTYSPYRVSSSIAGLVLAPRWKRLVALWLNGAAFGGILLLCFLPAFALAGQSRLGGLLGLALPIGGTVYWIRINLQLLGFTGQSYGKKWMGIMIVRTNGELAEVSHLVFKRYLGMQLLVLVPILGSIVGLIDALMIFGSEQRCLHDHFADTKVVIA